MLALIGLDRSKIYIANMVKCRPPHNRDPLPEEQEACRGWLERQIALIDPKIVVCLGRIAAMGLIREDFRITREHGIWVEKKGVWFMPTYHPAALLRDESKKREAWRDLQKVMEKMKEMEEEASDGGHEGV
jgi:DNA polymerase